MDYHYYYYFSGAKDAVEPPVSDHPKCEKLVVALVVALVVCLPRRRTFLGVRQAFLPSQTSAETKRYFPFFGSLLLYKETNQQLHMA